ncbi:MAG: M81 family metallopeptidase [Thermomicrobiales bacterium]|nr:M81 family metallopeptidase [Thermomicrobiales bacterium]
MARIAVGGFSHETNTFARKPTDFAEFAAEGIRSGAEILAFRGTKTPAGGFVDAIEANPGLEPVLLMTSNAIPGGVVTADAVHRLTTPILEGIEREKPDAVVLVLHGAMVTEESDDGEGTLLAQVRAIIGPDVPLLATLDPHANCTELMVASADALFPFDTYPHIDGYERAFEVVALLGRMLAGEAKPTAALARLPLISATVVEYTGAGLAKEIMERAFAFEHEAGVINVGVNWGFAYADTPITGMTFVVTTDNDPERARAIADDMAAWTWERRGRFVPSAMPVDEAIKAAMTEPLGPVVLADVADNPGGGTPCDGTAILWGLLDLGATDAAIGSIADPEVVEIAFNAGIGKEISCELGGKTDDLHGYPIPIVAEVANLTEGHFVYEGPMRTGHTGWLGRAAVLHVLGRHGNVVEVLVTERRFQTFDAAVLRSQGIEPLDKKIVVVKSSVHFRGAFGPLATRIIEVDTPGLLAIDLTRFDFKRLTRPIWPLDAEMRD